MEPKKDAGVDVGESTLDAHESRLFSRANHPKQRYYWRSMGKLVRLVA